MARDDTKGSKERTFSERRLVESARAGDLAAREEIVRQHQKMVYNLALRMTRNSDDAAVILQETFLKVFAALSRFRAGSRLKTWIYRIATNEALQHLRLDRTRTFVDIENVEADTERDLTDVAHTLQRNPHALLEDRELRKRLLTAIDKLPPKHRAAFVLVDIEGLSLKDAADAAKSTVAALKTNLHRARFFLRDQLADYLEGHADGG